MGESLTAAAIIEDPPDIITVSDTTLQDTSECNKQASDSLNTKEVKRKPDPWWEAIPLKPTQVACKGVRFDFCDGLRIAFEKDCPEYRVIFMDEDTGLVLFDQPSQPEKMVASVKKYYVKYRLQVFAKDKEGNFTKKVFDHTYNAKGKKVLIYMVAEVVGDSLAWFSNLEAFQEMHQCKLIVAAVPWIIAILKNQYPKMKFITQKDVSKQDPYAVYHMGIFFHNDVDHQPVDFRYIGLHKTIACLLGTPRVDTPPKFDLSAPRTIKEKYVCIAAQASSITKCWNNPSGWRETIKFLKDNGYRVLCIDKEHELNFETHTNHIPYGAEDFTGNLPLQERINLIKDADFFIGLSSGLSWLAWGCKVPVVLISGFTAPENEFYTPYRVINYNVCNSCWNDMKVEFDHSDCLWCPRHKGTPRHLECSRFITAKQVIDTIKRIPTFKPELKDDKEPVSN